MSESHAPDRVRQLVRRRVSELGLSLSDISLKIGRNHAYLQQFLERGVPRDLPEKIRPALAAILQVEESMLRGIDGRIESSERLTSPGPTMRPNLEPLDPYDLPVYAGAEGGPTGLQVTPDPIDWVPRPRPLRNVPKAFAVYVIGDSMEPAYRHGDMVFVHPALPALRGDDVLLTKQGSDRELVAMIKHLVGWSDRDWKLKQFNPEREFQVSKSEWPQVHVVVGKYNRR
jgi:phage repressor protein C with HTH and peptisase S24 domain